jgi:MFS family permease
VLKQTQRHIWREIGEGLRMVVAQPLLRPLVACQMTDGLFSVMLFAVYTLFLTQDLGVSPAVYGFLFAMFAPGSFLGAFLARPLGDRFGVGITMIGGQLLIAAGFVLRCVAGSSSLGIVAPLLIAHLAIGCGNRLYSINQISLKQAITPNYLYGRVNASILFLNSITAPIGAFVGGLLGQSIGLRPTIIVATAGVALATSWLVFSAVRTLHEIPAAVEESASGDAR